MKLFKNSKNEKILIESILMGFLFAVICFFIIYWYKYTNKETVDPVTNKKTEFINPLDIKWLILFSFFCGIVFYLLFRQISLSSKYSKILRQLQSR